MESENLEVGKIVESDEKAQYRVVRSRPRVYKSTIALKGLYVFNAFLLSIAFLFSVIPTVLLLLHLLDNPSASGPQFVAALGLTFFYPLTFFTLIALLLNLTIVFLLSLGIRKDLPLLTGIICLLTAAGHILILAFIGLCVLVSLSGSQAIDALAVLINFLRGLTAANPGVVALAISLQTLVTVYFLAFLMNGMKGFHETLTKTPLSTFFPSGVLVESFRKDDVEEMMKIYSASQRYSNPGKNSYELWKQLVKSVNLVDDVRVARFEENVVGFLITSQNFLEVKSVHLTSDAIADEAEECLLRDFIRLYSRSEKYVDFVEISSSDKKLQKALSHNGWKVSENTSSQRKVSFYYVGSSTNQLSD